MATSKKSWCSTYLSCCRCICSCSRFSRCICSCGRCCCKRVSRCNCSRWSSRCICSCSRYCCKWVSRCNCGCWSSRCICSRCSRCCCNLFSRWFVNPSPVGTFVNPGPVGVFVVAIGAAVVVGPVGAFVAAVGSVGASFVVAGRCYCKWVSRHNCGRWSSRCICSRCSRCCCNWFSHQVGAFVAAVGSVGAFVVTVGAAVNGSVDAIGKNLECLIYGNHNYGAPAGAKATQGQPLAPQRVTELITTGPHPPGRIGSVIGWHTLKGSVTIGGFWKLEEVLVSQGLHAPPVVNLQSWLYCNSFSSR